VNINQSKATLLLDTNADEVCLRCNTYYIYCLSSTSEYPVHYATINI